MDVVVKPVSICLNSQSPCFGDGKNQSERYAPHELPHPNHCGLKACSTACCFAQINSQMRRDLGLSKPTAIAAKNQKSRNYKITAFFRNLWKDLKIIFRAN